MKYFLYFIAFLVLYYVGSFTYMSIDSRRPREAGLVDGKLRPCPGTPNCVLSEVSGKEYIEPFHYSTGPAEAWAKIKAAVAQLGGKIEKESDTYLWATFKTKLWRFTDDLELRMDTENKELQVRSASRVGRGDLGMNRKRVEALRAVFNK